MIRNDMIYSDDETVKLFKGIREDEIHIVRILMYKASVFGVELVLV